MVFKNRLKHPMCALIVACFLGLSGCGESSNKVEEKETLAEEKSDQPFFIKETENYIRYGVNIENVQKEQWDDPTQFDSDRIQFSMSINEGRYDLYSMKLDGTDLRLVATEDELVNNDGRIRSHQQMRRSKDGRYISYLKSSESCFGCSHRMVMDLKTREAKYLGKGNILNSFTWSKVENKLLFNIEGVFHYYYPDTQKLEKLKQQFEPHNAFDRGNAYLYKEDKMLICADADENNLRMQIYDINTGVLIKDNIGFCHRLTDDGMAFIDYERKENDDLHIYTVNVENKNKSGKTHSYSISKRDGDSKDENGPYVTGSRNYIRVYQYNGKKPTYFKLTSNDYIIGIHNPTIVAARD